MTREKILERIRRLLAMADENNNASDNEREIAMRRAQALMEQHQISIIECGAEDDAGERGDSAVDVGSRPWVRRLYCAVALLYGCEAYYLTGTFGRVIIVGNERDRAIVLDLAAWLRRSIEREAKCRIMRDDPWSQGSLRAARTAFKLGAATGVRRTVSKLINERADRARDEPGRGAALVVLEYYQGEARANQQWLADAGIKLGRGRPATVGNRDAYSMGVTFGRSISLNRQIER